MPTALRHLVDTRPPLSVHPQALKLSFDDDGVVELAISGHSASDLSAQPEVLEEARMLEERYLGAISTLVVPKTATTQEEGASKST